jgi:hypothetical protein
MAKSEHDLAVEVLIELNVIEGEEEPSAADEQLVIDRYRSRLVTLVDDDYADWSANTIPDAAMPGLRLVIAYECARAFGRVPDASLEDEGLTKLARLMRRKATYEPVRPDYF